jgi:hypothetical protein
LKCLIRDYQFAQILQIIESYLTKLSSNLSA